MREVRDSGGGSSQERAVTLSSSSHREPRSEALEKQVLQTGRPNADAAGRRTAH